LVALLWLLMLTEPPQDGVSADLPDLLSHGAENNVYIKADARLGDGTVLDVLRAVGSIGVERVSFWVDQRRQSSSQHVQ
jgi:biopolymer transport protein ExbD